MNRSLTIAGIILVLLLGVGMFQVKHAVEERDNELDALYRKHVADQKAIRVLDAEWAYLNSPEYLQELALKHLKVAPTMPNQILDDLEAIPFRSGGIPQIAPASGGAAAGGVTHNEATADVVTPWPRRKPQPPGSRAVRGSDPPDGATPVRYQPGGGGAR